MKNFRIVPFLLALVVCTIACKKNNNATSHSTSSNTQITFFSVLNDSIEDCSLYAFTINNDSNVIYNVDSLPYLSDVSKLVPLIYGATLKTIIINDSVTYSLTTNDSIDFTHPVVITTTATDGVSQRVYLARVNVHQVNPADYRWKQVATSIMSGSAEQQKAIDFSGKLFFFAKASSAISLYACANGSDWIEQTLTGLPTSTDLSGIVATDTSLVVAAENAIYETKNGQDWIKNSDLSVTLSHFMFVMNQKIFALGEADGAKAIFSSADLQTWSKVYALPANFPVSDYAVCVDASETGIMRAFLIGGRSASGNMLATVWSSENGSYWTNLAAQREWFAPRVGSVVVQYDHSLVQIGGQLEDGTITDAMLQSPDYGLTWKPVTDTCSLLPDSFVARSGHSLIKTADNYLYIVGGQSTSGTLNDVWRGRKNAAIPGFLNHVP